MALSSRRMHRGCIGYWMSEKKLQKVNVEELEAVCRSRGFDLQKLDLTRPLDHQGSFCVIFHKCTELLAKAKQEDHPEYLQSRRMLDTLETYLLAHPEIPIVDNMDRVRRLLDRYRCYLAIRTSDEWKNVNVFVPNSVELTSADPNVNIRVLKTAGVKYPFVAKPSVAHGSTDAHAMAIVFNDEGVADIRIPSVAQTFVNHNALLFKLYCIGPKFIVQQRPSLKNFYTTKNVKTIFFSSTDVSKSDSTSSLSTLDDNDPCKGRIPPKPIVDIFRIIVDAVRKELGLELLGIDVVIENNTGQYAIIDVNSYPGYDGFPDLMESLVTCLEDAIQNHTYEKTPVPYSASAAGDQASSYRTEPSVSYVAAGDQPHSYMSEPSVSYSDQSLSYLPEQPASSCSAAVDQHASFMVDESSVTYSAAQPSRYSPEETSASSNVFSSAGDQVFSIVETNPVVNYGSLTGESGTLASSPRSSSSSTDNNQTSVGIESSILDLKTEERRDSNPSLGVDSISSLGRETSSSSRRERDDESSSTGEAGALSGSSGSTDPGNDPPGRRHSSSGTSNHFL